MTSTEEGLSCSCEMQSNLPLEMMVGLDDPPVFFEMFKNYSRHNSCEAC